MSDFAESGTHCESSTVSDEWATWKLGDPLPETKSPEGSLERALEVSIFMAEIGLKRTMEPLEMVSQLATEVAKLRHANKLSYDMMSAEIARLRARWSFDRTLANDSLEEVDDLEQQVILLREESGFNLEALITCQERLDNCLSMMDDLASYINWEEMTRD